jgi:hypothetical protein
MPSTVIFSYIIKVRKAEEESVACDLELAYNTNLPGQEKVELNVKLS